MTNIESSWNNRDDFDWEECEPIDIHFANKVYEAKAELSYDAIQITVDGCWVDFPLANLLNQCIDDIDNEHPEDQEDMVSCLLPILRDAVARLEIRAVVL